MHCREILFTARCSPRAREFPRLANFSVWRTVAELWGAKVAQFSDFGPFSPYKTPKTSSDQPTAQGWHRRMIMIFPCGSQRSQGMPSGSEVFLWLLVAELGPPNLPKFSPMANGYTHIEFFCTVDQRCLKMRSAKDGCTFPPMSSPLPSKSPQNSILEDLSVQTYYTESSP